MRHTTRKTLESLMREHKGAAWRRDTTSRSWMLKQAITSTLKTPSLLTTAASKENAHLKKLCIRDRRRVTPCTAPGDTEHCQSQEKTIGSRRGSARSVHRRADGRSNHARPTFYRTNHTFKWPDIGWGRPIRNQPFLNNRLRNFNPPFKFFYSLFLPLPILYIHGLVL